MKILRKTVCLLLALTMMLSVFPFSVFADTSEPVTGTYTIQNDYVRYSINAETGGFSVETLDGNPQKILDDKIPLLYKEDEDRSNGTSFTTIRINGKDYIFGRSYGFYGLDTTLHTPIVSDGGRLITVQWDINDITVIQEVALSAAADQDLTGNVGISYTVINHGTADATVGIRVLLDTALDSTVDAPYLIKDTDISPIYTEAEFSREAGTMPAQIRGVDSLSNPSKILYTFTKTWNNEASSVDRIIVGHWRNLANTRYEYTANEYCDFTNYSNSHRTPDSAIAYYWDEATLAKGMSRTAEILYGVGNFSSNVEHEGIGINMSIDNKVRLNEDGTGYVNDGKFDVTVVIDNSVDGAQVIDGAVLRISFEDGITSADGQVTAAFDSIAVGDIKTLRFHLQAEEQSVITSKTIGFTLTGNQDIDESTSRVATFNTQRSIVLPGVKGAYADIKVTSVMPETVFTEGEKTLTVMGEIAPLKALKGSDGWKMFLFHTTSDHVVEVDRNKVAFLNEACTQLSVSTEETLYVGEYQIGLEFTDTQLVQGFGAISLRFAKSFQVSNNPIYRSKSFGLMALIRYNTYDYTYIPFVNQKEYDNFLDGVGRNGDPYSENAGNGYPDIYGNLIAPFDPVDENDPDTLLLNEKEVILIMRGKFKEMKDEDGDIFYQAEAKDSDVIINEILKYTSNDPLIIKADNGIYTVSGDGKLKVISSIDVWSGKWSFQVNKGTITTLDSGRCQYSNANELSLTLGGVGYMVQSIGGFLIDIKYGVMSSSRPVSSDRTLLYNISFGGSISIPIAIPGSDKKKDEAENQIKKQDDPEDYSDTMHDMFGDYEAELKEEAIASGKTKPDTNFKKDTNLDSGLIAIAIDDILFGQEAEEDDDGHVKITDTGFIGINTTLSLGLPKDVLGTLVSNAPGVYASLTINTIDHFYMLEAGLDIKMIQCEGVLSFMMTEVKGVDVVVPDSIQFYIRDGLKIPVAPPALWISGLGGGIDGLADTIGGEFSKLPPLTLLLFARLDLVELLVGDFNVGLSLTGASFDGNYSISVGGILEAKPNKTPAGGGTDGGTGGGTGSGTGGSTDAGTGGGTKGINGAKDSPKNPANRGTFATTVINAFKSPINVSYGASVRWISPFNLNGYGNVSVIDGLLTGGVSITITASSFYGYAYLSLNIPESIPIIGGKEVAGIEAAISDKFIGANIKIIGIKLGLIYYWNGDFNIGTGINLRGMPGVSYPEYSANAVYATNLSKLEKGEAPMRFMARALSSDVKYDLTVSGQDSIVLEIPFNADELPTVDDIAVFAPNGTVTLVEDDGSGNGNFLVQSRDDNHYIYVSVTDPSVISDGIWTVQYNSEKLTVETFDVYGVEDIPEITDIEITRSGDVSSYDVDVAWTLDSTASSAGYIDVYMTKDKDLLAKIKTDDTEQQDILTLTRIRLDEVKSGSATVTIPDGMESGTYYIAAMLSNDVGGMSTVISDTTFEFVNNKLPKPVKSVSAKYAGNGDLYVKVEDADVVDYTHYVVEVIAEDGTTLTNNFNEYALDEDIYIGKEANLVPGSNYIVRVKTLRTEENKKYYYGTEIVSSAPFTMPAADKPVLVSVETNLKDGYLTEKELKVTYTFDRPVWMYAEVNNISLFANEFRDTWSFTKELSDGEYTVDFKAYGTNKDSVTGADFPNVENALMGFTVDNTAPSLSVKQNAYSSLADENVTAVFGANVVYADANGSFTIEGITDYDAALTAEGNTVTIENNGAFSYTGTLVDGENSREVLLRATDDAGNYTEITVFAVRGDMPVIESVEILLNGAPITRDENGEAIITVENGSKSAFTLVGRTADGDEIELDTEDVLWDVLYEKNIISFSRGSVTAKATGETAIKAGISLGTVMLADQESTDVLLEDYVIINISGGDKETLLTKINEAEENISQPMQATQSAIDTYRAAIDAAKEVYRDTEASGDDVTSAISAIEAATAAFNIAKIVSKDQLKADITAAEANIAAPKQASDTDISTYRAVIDAAIVVSNNDNASVTEVGDAIAALASATEAFNTAKTAVMNDLKAAITAAEANLADPKQAEEDAKTAYRAAIDAAIAVSGNENAARADVLAAIDALAAATDIFNIAKVVDKSALIDAIADAESNITAPKQATDSDISTYRTAIDAAIAASEIEDISKTELTNALSALAAATAAFDTAKVAAMNELKAAITAAEANIASPKQATESDVSTYRAAIDTAIAVTGNDNAARADVLAAIDALAAATSAFDTAKVVAMNELKAAITAAEANIAAPKQASEGDVSTYRAAIDAAIAVTGNDNAARADVLAAIDALGAATSAFDTAKAAAMNELKAAITAAEANIAAPKQATDSDISTYRAAIDAAITVSENENAARADVLAATDALAAATAAFNTAKTAAMNELKSAITAAEANLADPKQAEEEAKTAYRTAINAAIAVSENEDAARADVLAAIDDLAAATDLFNIAKVLDKGALVATIAAAEENISKPKQASESDISTYRAAIDAAIAANANEELTKDQLLAAVSALDSATAAFDTAKVAVMMDLKAAITAAEANIAAPKQADENAVSAYRTAINMAITVTQNEDISRAYVLSTIAALAKATSEFDTAKVAAMNELKAVITAAEANLADPKQASAAAISAYRAAIDAAIAVSGNEDAARADVLAAISALADATGVFNEEKIRIIGELKAAISEAEKNIADSFPADEAAIKAYREAIDEAVAVSKDASVTEQEVKDAIASLAAATEAFNTNREENRAKINYISVIGPVNGKVSISQEIVYKGCSLTIISTPNTDYEVDEVFINGKYYSSDRIITIPSVTEDLTILVTFKRVWTNPFADVKTDEWYYDAVSWACKNGVTTGTTANTFSPDEVITRAMLVTFLWRAAGCPEVGQSSGFKDVSAKSYYAEAVAWAKANGIVNGVSAKKFAPEDPVTREQVAAIVYRYAVYKGYDVSVAATTSINRYTDAGSVSDYAVTAMKYAVGTGLIEGRTSNTLVPAGTATRAEGITMLYRFINEVK